jgi:histidyl-tRNA synthetase
MKIQRPRGTRDFLPREMSKRRFMENRMRNIAERWGYEEIKTPAFEHLDLFTMKSGEEIVEEIYHFKDKSGRDIALRPELTAPVMRMYANELKMNPKPLKFYYFDNCFRYERPQRNRFREFWQFGVEVIGGKTEAEAEVIALASTIANDLNIKGGLNIGHLGVIRHILRDLSPNEQNRILRLVDKKDEIGIKNFLGDISSNLGRVPTVDRVPEGRSDVLSAHRSKVINLLLATIHASSIEEARRIIGEEDCFSEFEEILQMLSHYEVGYTIDFGIARGLEYYDGMVFEIYSDGVQICGGGSYRLSRLFGGDDVSSTGFAFGFDRVVEISPLQHPEQTKVVVASTEDVRGDVIRMALQLREHVPTYLDIMSRGLSDQLAFANSIGASFAVIVGKRELEKGKVTLKDMQTEEQRMVDLDECIKLIVSSPVRRNYL